MLHLTHPTNFKKPIAVFSFVIILNDPVTQREEEKKAIKSLLSQSKTSLQPTNCTQIYIVDRDH